MSEKLDEHQLELAMAQFTGFGHARKGYDVQDLVGSMGLTKAEWDAIRNDAKVWLQEEAGFDDFTEVDEYFRRQK